MTGYERCVAVLPYCPCAAVMVFASPRTVAFPLLLGGLLLGAVLGRGAARPPSSFSTAPPDTLEQVRQEVFEATNAERRAAGRSALSADPGLRDLACRHTRDMLVRDFMGHENPDGVGPGARAGRYHRRLIGETGENVLSRVGRRDQSPAALAEELVRRWMDSRPHRKNILRRGFTHLGVCVMQDGDQLRATQSFARVRGWISPPLPFHVPAGRSVPMTVSARPSHRLTASRYDLWSPTEERTVAGPRALAGSLHVPDTTGTFRVRFYFPESDRYAVHLGPTLSIKSPSASSRASSSTPQ